jgi:hypothetical protein
MNSEMEMAGVGFGFGVLAAGKVGVLLGVTVGR